MRTALFGTVLIFAAFPAMAASIEKLEVTEGEKPSIMHFSCADCRQQNSVKTPDYSVPVLGKGTQRVEIHETDDGAKLVRVEAWMGGSPVRQVSSQQAKLVSEIAEAEQKLEEQRLAAIKKAEERERRAEARKAEEDRKTAEIDTEAKTAAISASPNEASKAPDNAPFNPNSLDLRVK